MEYYSLNGVYPTAAQLGYATASDGMTLTNPSAISPYLSNLYIPGSVTDGTSNSNPMGYAIMTLNSAAFPSNMASGTDPGFLAYSFGQQIGENTNPFIVGCETAFSIDGLAGAAGNYSYVTCPSGTPYQGGSGHGGANLPQVCTGCSLSTVLAAATGSSSYLGGSSGGGSGGGGSGGGGGGLGNSTGNSSGGSYTNGTLTLTQSNGNGNSDDADAINQTIGVVQGILQQFIDNYISNGSFPASFTVDGYTVSNGEFWPQVTDGSVSSMTYSISDDGQGVIFQVTVGGLSGVPGYEPTTDDPNNADDINYGIRIENGNVEIQCGQYSGYGYQTLPEAYLPSGCTCGGADNFAASGSC